MRTIETAICNSYRDTTTTSAIYSVESLFKLLSIPSKDHYQKDGPQILIGPCSGKRAARNISRGELVFLDADKSVDKTGVEVDGAPCPYKVHEALKGWGITHCLYTTFSHGQKGNRYRIVFPIPTRDKGELKAASEYLVWLLQAHAGLPIALARESFVWGQGWALPRVPYEGASFLSLQHIGQVPDASDLRAILGVAQESKAPPSQHEGEIDSDCVFSLVDQCFPVQSQLIAAGYQYVSQGVMADSQGNEMPVFRYRPPNSTSAPGVVVFKTFNRWKVYSHHQNDPLCNGHTNDSFDTFCLLNNISSEVGMRQLVPHIQNLVIDQLNVNHPSILEQGSKFRYGNRVTDELWGEHYVLMEPSSFSSAMKTQQSVPVISIDSDGMESVNQVPRSEFWENCNERILYNGLMYYPCPVNAEPQLDLKRNGKLYFNTFRSWKVKPAKGHWPLLEQHLREAICGEVEEEYRYLIDWFSHLFQCPQEKPQVAVVLQGGRGWGKTMLFSELAKALGSHAFIAANTKLLTGNFNHHLRHKMLLVVEESFWSGNHAARGVLQHVISDEVTGYEKKGMDAEQGRSFLRVAMISNEDWVVPAAGDSRRYFIPSLNDSSKRKDIVKGIPGKFFPRLLNELRKGGLQAFIHDMGSRNFDRLSIRKVPRTDRLVQQREISLDWLDRWFMESLMEGAVVSVTQGRIIWTSEGCSVPRELLRESLKLQREGSVTYSDQGLLNTFGVRARRILHRMHRRSITPAGPHHLFGPLELCRKAFEEYANIPIDWDDSMSAMVPAAEQGGKHRGTRH